MDINNLFTAGVLFSGLTYLGYQLKSIPSIIWKWIRRKTIFIVTVEELDPLYLYIERWLRDNKPNAYKNVEATLMTTRYGSGDLPETCKSNQLQFWNYNDFFVMIYGKGKNKRRLVINKGREKLEGSQNIRNAYLNRYNISGFLAKKTIIQLLEHIVTYNDKFKEIEPPKMFMSTSWGDWRYVKQIKTKSLDSVIFENKQQLITDIDNFINDREWYIKRSISYKRGYLLYGLPGNGKTTTCMSIAQYLNRNIYFISLNDLEEDKHLYMLFNTIDSNSILVLEDIDSAFVKRDNGKTGISFSALLNSLDGAFSREDVIVILTTNHKDKLDPALIRNGRVDLQVEITNPKLNEVKQYIELFYSLNDISLTGFNDSMISMVDIQNICLGHKDNSDMAIRTIINRSQGI